MQKLIQIQNAIKAARGNGKYKVDNDVLFSAIDEALDYVEELRDEIEFLAVGADEECCESVPDECDCSEFQREEGVNYRHSNECRCDNCYAEQIKPIEIRMNIPNEEAVLRVLNENPEILANVLRKAGALRG